MKNILSTIKLIASSKHGINCLPQYPMLFKSSQKDLGTYLLKRLVRFHTKLEELNYSLILKRSNHLVYFRKSRKWRKKVSYDCRKRVADGRLRIKGKFVTREQVCSQLGFENLDDYTAEQIKELM